MARFCLMGQRRNESRSVLLVGRFVVLVSPVSSVSVDCLRVGAVGGCGQNPDVNSTAETFPLLPHRTGQESGKFEKKIS